MTKLEKVRRYCATCGRVTNHKVHPMRHQCEPCGSTKRRYDLTKRPWAGV